MDDDPTAAPDRPEGTRAAATGWVPTATYRLQLRAEFGFRDAAAIVPYLAELGIDGLYSSPIFATVPGSSHGYDAVDYGELSPELGGEEGLVALDRAQKRHGLGYLLDVVPNHMGIAGGHNRWWNDVLENGASSPYADFFDVDWRPLKPELRGKVLLPFLGDQYGAVLDRGELRLERTGGAFAIRYFDTPFPVAPPTYPRILRQALDGLLAALPAEEPALLEFQSIITALEHLPDQAERDPERIAERQREQVIAKRRLAELIEASPAVRAAVDGTVESFNGRAGELASFDRLDQLLDEQSYRLAYWRVAAEEINYRRFFAINELAAIRQEEPAVFAATHDRLLRLVADGIVTGLRIDHPDGLWDPAGYVCRLQAAAALARSTGDSCPRPAGDGRGEAALPIYLVVEKILEHGEPLPDNWAVHGTVGYDFAAAATGLFIDEANRAAFDQLYARYIGTRLNYGEVVDACKHVVMRRALVSEVNVLAQALNRISEQDRRTRDFTLNTLRDALREVIACLPVYRTYLVCEEGTVPERDRRYVESAVARARRRNPAIDPSVFDFLRDVLVTTAAEVDADLALAERFRFAMKWQQLTGPVMAKGIEDTASYRYNRLVALNEVGADPARFGVSVGAFHRQNQERRRRWPDAMLTTATHDTKRGEDVRARIAVLSELPREWRAAVNRWARLNRRHKTRLDGRAAPDRNDEYLLYQTLLGAWPFGAPDDAPDAEFVERIVAYMEKATREAQVNTSWTQPDDAYEAATRQFVRRLLDPATGRAFLADSAALRARVGPFGVFNGLAQQVLKLTSPGVPDVYQGTELWDLSLVDPDNRRPVDFGHRRRLLRELRRRRPSPRLAGELLATKEDGRIKLYVTWRTLAYRGERRRLFARGEYLPLATTGLEREHVCAFARRDQAAEVVVAVPRLVVGLCRGEPMAPVGAAVWGEAGLVLPEAAEGAAYRNLFTGEVVDIVRGCDGLPTLPLAAVFAAFPVALLERIDAARLSGSRPDEG